MKKDDIVTQAERSALLEDRGEMPEEEARREMDSSRLASLQETVTLLSRQVELLRDQVNEQFQLQHRQQEQMLAQFKYLLEYHLRQQFKVVMEQHADQPKAALPAEALGGTEPEAVIAASSEAAANQAEAENEEERTYSRMKSYAKIRKRRKTFLERLFE